MSLPIRSFRPIRPFRWVHRLRLPLASASAALLAALSFGLPQTAQADSWHRDPKHFRHGHGAPHGWGAPWIQGGARGYGYAGARRGSCDRDGEEIVVYRRSPRGHVHGYTPWGWNPWRGGTSLVIRIGD